MPLPTLLWVSAALVASSATMFKLFYPKLPVYDIQVDGLPMLTGLETKVKVGAKVSLTNENLMDIDIHAVTFDLFYPNNNGSSLVHLGRVRDKYQHLKITNTDFEAMYNVTKSGPPFWSLPAKSKFETSETMYLYLSAISSLTESMSSLGSNLYENSQHLTIPSSGVMQVRASKKSKVTISILCDNALDAWTQRLQGLDCILNSVNLGWVNIDTVSDKVKKHVLATVAPNATGGILPDVRSKQLTTKAKKKFDSIFNKEEEEENATAAT